MHAAPVRRRTGLDLAPYIAGDRQQNHFSHELPLLESNHRADMTCIRSGWFGGDGVLEKFAAHCAACTQQAMQNFVNSGNFSQTRHDEFFKIAISKLAVSQVLIMGNSLHNKIYLGRRSALLNLRRVQMVATIGALVLLGAISFFLAKGL